MDERKLPMACGESKAGETPHWTTWKYTSASGKSYYSQSDNAMLPGDTRELVTLESRSNDRCEFCKAFHKEFTGELMTASCLHPEGLRKVYATGDALCSHFKPRDGGEHG